MELSVRFSLSWFTAKLLSTCVAPVSKKNCLTPKMTSNGWEEKLSRQHFLTVAFGGAIVAGSEERSVLGHLSFTAQSASWAHWQQPQRDDTRAPVSSVNLHFELLFYYMLILYSIKIEKESFLALLHYSERSLYIKGENWVLSRTLPSFSFMQCSPLSGQKGMGNRHNLSYLIRLGRRKPEQRVSEEESRTWCFRAGFQGWQAVPKAVQ